jgi:hypothetical protein
VTTFALPPYQGPGVVEVLRARGVGDQRTKLFHIAGTSLVGTMENGGRGARFWLVDRGLAFDSASPPTAKCDAGCTFGGWSGQYTVGDYYLVVIADATWSFDLQLVRA